MQSWLFVPFFFSFFKCFFSPRWCNCAWIAAGHGNGCRWARRSCCNYPRDVQKWSFGINTYNQPLQMGVLSNVYSPQEAVCQREMTLVQRLVAGVVAELPCPAGRYLFVLVRTCWFWHHRLMVSQSHRNKDKIRILIPQSAELWLRQLVLPATKRPWHPFSRLEESTRWAGLLEWFPLPGLSVPPPVFTILLSQQALPSSTSLVLSSMW